jgi:hypothetical protein
MPSDMRRNATPKNHASLQLRKNSLSQRAPRKLSTPRTRFKNRLAARANHQTEPEDLFGQWRPPKPGACGVQVPKNPLVPQTESTEFCG